MTMGHKPPVIPVLAIIVIAISVYFAWGYYSESAVRGRILATGTIEAVEVSVGTKVAGRVSEFTAGEGASVNKGDVIAVVDAPELKAQLRSATAAMEAAKLRAEETYNDYERVSDLFEQAMATEQQYDAAKYMAETAAKAQEQAAAALEIARIKADDTLIKTPIPGTILVKAVETGELVSSGSTIATMADLEALELKVYVTEKQLGLVRLGAEARVAVDSFPEALFKGTVSYISSKAEFTPKTIQTKEERVNQMYEVKISIPNKDLRLKPGMPADAEIIVEQ